MLEVLNSLEQQGFAIHKRFLDQRRVAALRERVVEQADLERKQGVAEVSHSGTASGREFCEPDAAEAIFQAVSFLPNKGKVFRELAMEPVLHEYLRYCFSDVPYNLATQAATLVRAGGEHQVFHSDQQAWPFLTPLPALMTSVVCLSEFSSEMGSTRVVPGTHRGSPPEISIDTATGRVANPSPIDSLAIEAESGDLVMWDGRLWHAQGASTAAKTRIAIIQVFAMHMVKPQDVYPAIVHDDVYAKLSEAERQMLGFEVHFEYAGRIAPRHSEDRRSNTNYSYPFVPELRRDSDTRAVPLPDAHIGRATKPAQMIDT